MSGLQRFIAVHQLRAQTAPRVTRAIPAPHQGLTTWVDSSHHVMFSQKHVSPYFQLVFEVLLPTTLGPYMSRAFFHLLTVLPHTLCNEMYLWPQNNPVRCFSAFNFLHTKIHFFLVVHGFELFTVVPLIPPHSESWLHPATPRGPPLSSDELRRL